MNEALLLAAGVTAALSPCPLATNMAAVGYMARQVGLGRAALACALLYAAGRMAAYVLLGLLLHGGLVSMPALSYALQETLPLFMGPLLLLAGLVMLEALPLPAWLHTAAPSRGTADTLMRGGVWGAFPLGMLFALALCPPSAALFFGVALPMAAQAASPAWVALACFGLGTALPVMAVGLLLASGAAAAARLLRGLPALQRTMRWIAGGGMLLLGAWLTLVHLYQL